MILASFLDRVTLVHLFRLVRVVCRHVFEVISKFEEKMDFSMNLTLFSSENINIVLVTYHGLSRT